MDGEFVNLTQENLNNEHLCCAIADKKHQPGVGAKKAWLSERIPEGHVFRKLNAKAKVFIEYAPLEYAWIPVDGGNYVYIYCLWVAGSYKGKGYGSKLLDYCIEDAKSQGKSGVCVISSSKKKPYLTDKKFVQKFGFETVDTLDADYELLALSFDGTKPKFAESARTLGIESKELTIYYSSQCPYTQNCIEQVEVYCKENNVPLTLAKLDSLEKAKTLPCVFNNWAVFCNGKFETLHLLNEGYLEKLLEKIRINRG